MRKINDKNLRREVRRQLKELHGRVGMNAVGELGTQTITPTRTSCSSPLKRDNAESTEYEANLKELSPFKGDADAKGASVATTGTSVSQRSPQKAYRERSERNGGGNSAPNADTDLMINGERLTKNDEGLTINDERLAVSGEQLEGSDEGDIFNSQFSIFNSKRPTLPELELFIRRDYDLRYNVLTEQTEYRRKDDVQAEFRPATQRVYRTWLTDLQRAGVEFWKIDGLRTAIESMHIEDYHPVIHFFGTLPPWDGVDRIRPLMRRLTRDEVMVGYLYRWMMSFVAQAQGREGALYANSVAPILISEQQGWHKSTFCRLLLPPELRMFYTDNFNLTAESQCERRLTDSLLINLDEYDRYSARKQSTLKNLMQMPSLRVRKAYARNATTLPRIASFIGTSNTPHLLTDTTGSRRFLCVELTEMIDVDTPIAYEQLYAQCIHLLNGGERHHFTAEEVADIELRNRAYRHIPPVEEYCMKYFRQPQEGETPLLLSAAEIYEELRQRHPRLMRGVNEQNFGALLREWGFERVEHRHRRVYRMMRVEG